jgi:hypothetical protein
MFPQSKAAPFVGNDVLTRAFPPALQNINHDFTEKQWSTFEGVSEYLLKLKEQPTFKLRASSFQSCVRRRKCIFVQKRFSRKMPPTLV